jgi:DNA-binding NtrC family response regulator
LVSNDPALVATVRAAHRPIDVLDSQVCASCEEASALLEKNDIAALFVHVLPESASQKAAEQLLVAARRHHIPTIVLSPEYNDRQAVAFLRAGAADYLGGTLEANRLAYFLDVLTVRRRTQTREHEDRRAKDSTGSDREPLFYAWTPAMAQMMQQVRRVAPQETTLLLTGETGTGKSRLARLIHELSPRRDEPFLVVDCGALSPSLIESEMFGHVKGAFTGADRDRSGKFAAVGRGTLLLDEINALPPALQSKLLRAVEDRVFEPVGSNRPTPLHARLMAVCNTPLPQEIEAGRFRADLYYRLNVVEFYLPPLRERRDVVRHLANKFMAEFGARDRHDIHEMTPEALRALEDYSWPGNIREMRNAIERALALCPGRHIDLQDIPESVRAPQAWTPTAPVIYPATTPAPAPTLAASREGAEIERILAALDRNNNNRMRAAAELGISRMGLYKKLHKYGMMRPAS